MKIVWAHNWFLDYRIPVYKELSRITGDNLFVLYNRDNIPERVSGKVDNALGEKAISFTGEKRLTIGNPGKSGDFANRYISLKYQPGLYRKIVALRPDVVVGEGFFRWGLTNLIVRARHKIPYVMLYERTSYTERNAATGVLYARKAAMRLIDAICCNGIQSREYVEGLGYSQERITNGHMAADIYQMSTRVNSVTIEQKETLRRSLGIFGRVYIYVGQLIPRKGLEQLIETWKVFLENNADEHLQLLILGDGANRSEYEQLSKDVRGVKFIGKIDYDEIHKYLAISDISITPTLEDNWSLVVPEAMAAGLPVATSIYNGCHPELVKKSNGWVFDPLNKENFLETLQKTLVPKSELLTMGKSSLNIVSGHSPQAAAHAILEACQIAQRFHARRS